MDVRGGYTDSTRCRTSPLHRRPLWWRPHGACHPTRPLRQPLPCPPRLSHLRSHRAARSRRSSPRLYRRRAPWSGNGAYAVGPAQNAVKDATDIAAMLDRLGFEVTFLRNVPPAGDGSGREGVQSATARGWDGPLLFCWAWRPSGRGELSHSHQRPDRAPAGRAIKRCPWAGS